MTAQSDDWVKALEEARQIVWAQTQTVTWEASEADQEKTRLRVCAERRRQWPGTDDECDRDGRCEECTADMAEAHETPVSKAVRAAGARIYAALAPVHTPDTAQGGVVREAEDALAVAAKALVEACYHADVLGELHDAIDGSLLDAVTDALNARYPVIWSEADVEKLNAWQQRNDRHPYTCGGDRSDAAHRAYAEEEGEDCGVMIATKRGWVCPVFDYRQFWAHGVENHTAHPSSGITQGRKG